MKFTICLCVLNHPVTLFIEDPSSLIFFTLRAMKVIMIHKIITCIIWRVNINHLDLAHIGVLEQFQHFEVVALDVKVLGLLPIHTFLRTRTQRLVDRCCSLLQGGSFTNPREVIDFGIVFHGVVSKQQTEFVEVHYTMDFSVLAFCFGETRGGNLIKGVEGEARAVRGLFFYMFEVFHNCGFLVFVGPHTAASPCVGLLVLCAFCFFEAAQGRIFCIFAAEIKRTRK